MSVDFSVINLEIVCQDLDNLNIYNLQFLLLIFLCLILSLFYFYLKIDVLILYFYFVSNSSVIAFEYKIDMTSTFTNKRT